MRSGPALVPAVFLAASVSLIALGAVSAQEGTWDEALEGFWKAASESRLRAAARRLAAAGDFAAVFEALERGRPYSSDVRTGRSERSRRGRGGLRHPYYFLVPESYDPSRRYPVRFYLHGGVNRPAFDDRSGWWRNPDRMRSEDYIAVFPASWNESLWWQPSQIENLGAILDDLARTYNVDENRVYMIGVSDGGSGVYYQAMYEPMPWAAFLPFIGHMGVVMNEKWIKGDLHLPNLSNRAFFIVNGELDRLYPVRAVEPWIELLREVGVELDFRPQQGGGHDLAWWDAEVENIEAFIAAQVRDPLPDRLVWETGARSDYNRFSWLVIESLGEVEGETEFPPLSRATPMPYRNPYGRVAILREGNTINVWTAGVRSYTLLLSPTVLDLEQPVRVFTNTALSFEGLVEPHVETLLRWAARDHDRTMLFAAELEIEVGAVPRDPSAGRLERLDLGDPVPH